jgi:cell division protein FtsN
MARDYKTTRRRRPATTGPRRSRARSTTKRRRSRRQTPGWVWLLAGLGLGLGVAVGVYVYQQDSAPHHSPRATAPAKAAPTAKPAPTKPDNRDTAADGDKGSHFDFYTLLPKMEVVIPDSAIEEANRNLPQAEEDLAYVLQTGSFRNADDAEAMKAELALLGVEADIETVVINDRETWHRVRLGPFPSLAAVNPVRQDLRRHNIDFILLKVRL